MIELLPWILVINIWTDPPPKIQFVYKKEFPSHEKCMQAKEEWIKTNNPPSDFKVLCLLK